MSLNQKSIDWVLIFLVVLLYFFGVLTLYSIDEDLGKKQLTLGLMALAVIFAGIVLTHNKGNIFLDYSPIFYGICIVLLIGLFPFGKEINGAKAWYSFGKFSLQPAEFAKIASGLMISKILSENEVLGRQTSSSFLKSIVVLIVPVSLILLQPDLGSIIVFSAFLIALIREGLSLWIVLIPSFFLTTFVLSIIWDPTWVIIGFAFLILLSAHFTLFFLSYIISNYARNYILTSIFVCLCILFQILMFIEIYQTSTLTFSISNLFEEHLTIMISFFGFVLSLISGIVLNKSNSTENEIFNENYILKDGIFSRHFINASLVFMSIFLIFIGISYSSKKIFESLPKHQKERIMVLFEGEDKYRKTSGYNLLQSKIAIGTGQLTGKGWNKGPLTDGKHVPEQHTDYIFTAIAEEWGFVGSALVIIIYASLICRIYYLAENQKSVFNRYFGNSIASIILLHFSLNVAMVTGLFPTVGIPLPFISYGGSSLWASCLMIFIFLKNNFEESESLL